MDENTLREKKEFDRLCKEIFTWKVILAWILRACVTELQGMTIEEIIDCIEGTPEINATPLFENRAKIAGSSGEDTGFAGEETIYFDIRVALRLPQGNGKVVEILINVEPQSDRNPGYPLICRAIYYASRMISGQYGTVFNKSHYEKLEKVYSIWICLRPYKRERNSITRYRLTEDCLVGSSSLPRELYDKIAVVMVYLGSLDKTDDKSLQLLDGLVGPGPKPENPRAWLKEEFGVQINEAETEEVKKVQGFADMFIQDGAAAERKRILRFLQEENKDGSLNQLIAGVKSLPLETRPAETSDSE